MWTRITITGNIWNSQGYTLRLLPVWSFLQDSQPRCISNSASTQWDRSPRFFPSFLFPKTKSSGNVLCVIGRHFFTGFKQVRPSTTFQKAHDSAATAAHHHVEECPTPSGRAMCCSSITLRKSPRMQGEQDNRRPRMIAPVACEPSASTCQCWIRPDISCCLFFQVSTAVHKRAQHEE